MATILRSLQRPPRLISLAPYSRQLPSSTTFCFRPASSGAHGSRRRLLQTSAPNLKSDVNSQAVNSNEKTVRETTTNDPDTVYHGPLTQTFRRLKIFSLSSLTLSFAMTPFIFLIETASAVPFAGRVALAGTVLATSSVSTALVAWCGQPYVTSLRWLPSHESTSEASDAAGKQASGVELMTMTLGLHRRITRVYDTAFLVPTNRPFAKWELAEVFKLPETEAQAEKCKSALPREETIAETTDKEGSVIGRWIVKWDESGTGACRGVGKINRWRLTGLTVLLGEN
ncbi:hypothetical protein PHLCEN_2v11437 [Hermanssonia centrifuga]|uniref:Uncharacterized protein n=1 Tax=Hermanssonia centrifuga TaxID=98765 RepID=A0A2R6NL69_9APHY|nr:hypothetical protein PHLCEN_2v11437 [Hermanssonia centrifuga]